MTTKRKETRESVCYREIKKKIRNGELKPGDRLIENTLSQQLEISRTPIRKAIGMLAADGYVEYNDFRGAFVRDSIINKERYFEMTEIIGLFLKQAIQKIRTKKITFNKMRVVAKLVEIEREQPTDPATYFEYEKWFVSDLLTYMKNNYYLKISDDFFNNIQEFGDEEVIKIAQNACVKTIANIQRFIDALDAQDYDKCIAIIDQVIDAHVLVAYR
ncbi:GntR family transcriptional regulator [Listeria monocytogenes]|uniref:GntR family transcriptional regulator n=3 Tax=Listeria monocytogenes TaxID=1639 RepID=A0A5D5UGL4_LISMN|nr:GntR family transcriptional regulator [Listeria monocytogenes]EAF3073124.1 GntR family transcriptional regulator [Listeria monocytogenes serotype 1/2a]EFR85380.1 GntR family transcriptional regulator [Listeria monocytogenes FSL F2-208]MCY61224.1 GntR family transcriptional regulator [Listeria monocytogenes serotype 4c]ACK40203.1 transcriptional regulator, GntR family [Listeria monocytogenes HCC23]AEH91802.1 putative transcription regulator, GntR family [Listeria monocytogenes M7]